MFNKISKVFIALGIASLTLGILLLGYVLYEHQFLQKPLTNALNETNLVEDYKIVDNPQKILKVKVAKVDNFFEDFQKFMEKSQKLLLDKKLSLELISNSNSKLNEFYKELHPAIYEALSLDNFSVLQDKFNTLSTKLSLTNSQMFVTDDYILFQVEDGDFYLYKVFRRDSNKVPFLINDMGSDTL